MPRSIALTLALASALAGATADAPLRLPDLALEQGERLAYAYPPYDALTLGTSEIVRVTELGDGKVEWVATAVGEVEISLVTTRKGRTIAYAGRIEVLTPLEELLRDEARAALKQLPAVAVDAKAAGFLALAHTAYDRRGVRADGLYQAYVHAGQAWFLYQSRGSAAQCLDANELFHRAAAELAAYDVDAARGISKAIEARDWKRLAAQLNELVRRFPGARDRRHRRAQYLRSFYAPFFVPLHLIDSEGWARQARDLASQLELERLKQTSDYLYHCGEGEKVAALLKDTDDPALVAFREKVAAVHDVYLLARAHAEARRLAPAREMWELLKRVVADPSNQYYKWAKEGIQACDAARDKEPDGARK